jgi:hypothetical protein
MALDTSNNAGDEPGRLTHLDDRNDRGVLVQGSGGPAQIVELLCHESGSIASSDDGDMAPPSAP